MTRRAAALVLAACVVIALGCGGGEDEPTGPCVNEFTGVPTECSNPSAISASEADTTPASTSTTTAGATGASSTVPTSTSTTATQGAPIEQLVAAAAEVAADEVSCGEEALEEAIASAGTCEAGNTDYVVADREEDLELDTLTVRLADLATQRTVSGKFKSPRDSKNGKFVIATLSVENTGTKKAQFDNFGEQVRLTVDSETFDEPFGILNGVATDSFLWKAEMIKPGDRQVGKVVFDVPQEALIELETNGAIQVLNFGYEGNVQRSEQIGLLRTGESAV